MTLGKGDITPNFHTLQILTNIFYYLICCTNNNHNADSIQYSEMNIYLISTTWNYFHVRGENILHQSWPAISDRAITASKLAANFGPAISIAKCITLTKRSIVKYR